MAPTPAAVAIVEATSGIGLPENLSRFVAWLRQLGYEDGLWSGLLVASALALGWLGALVLLRLIGSAAKRTRVEVDDIVLRHVAVPIRTLLPLFVLRSTLALLSLPAAARDWLEHALLVLLVLGIGWVLLRLTRAGEELVKSPWTIQGV
jgi:hypothetical protein